MNWEVPWSRKEGDIYSCLIDDPLTCPWEIVDLLSDYGLNEVSVQDSSLIDPNVFLEKAIRYINGELSRENSVFPSGLLRERMFPRIRQMRDVHQFDVGTHLAACHAIAVRRLPIALCKERGLTGLSRRMSEAIDKTDPIFVSLIAIYHDFFKCFRQRRALPSKVGESLVMEVRAPSGKVIPAEVLADEGVMASELLTEIYPEHKELLTNVGLVAQISSEFGSEIYRRLKTTEDQELSSQVIEITETHGATTFWLSVYMTIVDWFGKGNAQFVVTVRKGGKKSLQQAGMEWLTEVNKLETVL